MYTENYELDIKNLEGLRVHTAIYNIIFKDGYLSVYHTEDIDPLAHRQPDNLEIRVRELSHYLCMDGQGYHIDSNTTDKILDYHKTKKRDNLIDGITN